MISIDRTADTVTVQSPYHPEFSDGARRLRGQWSATTKVWTFDARDEQRVRELCRDIYGTDGTPCELVTVRVPTAGSREFSHEASVFAFGRQLARRYRRDSSPVLGVGVVIVEGRGFPGRGGSAKYPCLEPFDDTVLEVRDVPRDIAEREIASTWTDAEIVSLEAPPEVVVSAMVPGELAREFERAVARQGDELGETTARVIAEAIERFVREAG